MNVNSIQKNERVARFRCLVLAFCIPILWFGPLRASAADTFNWRASQNRVTADIQSGSLPGLLEQITAATGWQVFVEPDTAHTVSAKFKNLPPGEALRLLLGDLSFALVPETNRPAKLFVFRTAQRNATQLVHAKKEKGKLIPNELIV